MKRKVLKGFTLVELIVVMALMSLLMVAIMRMFKPIRETFVDSTAYESHRTVQTGMVRYITESIRFSTDLGFYTKTASMKPADAVKAFADKYADANGFDSTDPRYDEVLKNAEVIVIDRATGYNWNADHTDGQGRILRRKITNPPSKLTSDPMPSNVPNSEWRLALGTQYYGDKNDYSIILGRVKATDPQTALESGNISDGIKVTVASVAQTSLKSKSADINGNTVNGVALSNSGEVICLNLLGGGIGTNANAGVKTPGIFDISSYSSGTMTTSTVYIVFLNEKI